MKDLTLALWQTAHRPTVEAALAALDAAAARAHQQGADLLVTPEMALTGYLIGPERVAALAQPVDGPLMRDVARIARRHRLAIACGYPRANPGGRPFNAVAFIGADGRVRGGCDKTHLYGDADAAQFAPGAALGPVFTWRGWRLGLLICYDVEFPETVHALAQAGAHVVLVPTANMREFDEVPRQMVPARARDNGVFVAYANACGREGDTRYGGLSTVAGPRGAVLARAGRGEALLLATLTAQSSGNRLSSITSRA